MRVVIMHFVEFAAFTSKKIQDRIRCHQDTLKYCHAVPPGTHENIRKYVDNRLSFYMHSIYEQLATVKFHKFLTEAIRAIWQFNFTRSTREMTKIS